MGYDRTTGICLCKADNLEEICNLECRVKQKLRVGFVCAKKPEEPYIRILNADNTEIVSFGSV